MVSGKMSKVSGFPFCIYSFGIFLATLDILLDGSDSARSEVEKHLEMGKTLLAKGHLQDALSHYHAAVEGDPYNYLTFFKRATVYLALGKARLAIYDLNKALELKPDFNSARVQRGNILLKQGRLDEAHIDFEKVLRAEPTNQEAEKGYIQIEPLKRVFQEAYQMMEGKDYQNAVIVLTSIIETCPWDANVREMRSNCYVALGDLVRAISDLRTTTKLISDNTVGYYKLAELYYKLGEADESLNEVRECLKLDPEHSSCFAHYKKVKKVAKLIHDMQDFMNEENYDDCIKCAKKVLKIEATSNMIIFQAKDKLCHCYLKNKELSESLKNCDQALEIQEEPRILCDRAEVYIVEEMLEEAIRDYHRALELDENFQRAKEGLQRAQKLEKQLKKRDYYKILGVRRTAGKREIMKAYRKLAQKWHPDNFSQSSEEDRKKSEKKFMDIASAKEVLTDPEKRQKYDNGEDPLDPESQQGQGFNPFQHFHNGGPFQFKFHFN